VFAKALGIAPVVVCEFSVAKVDAKKKHLEGSTEHVSKLSMWLQS